LDHETSLVVVALDIIYYDKENDRNICFHNFLSGGNVFDYVNSKDEYDKKNKYEMTTNNTKTNEKYLLIVFNLFLNKINRIFYSNCRIIDCMVLGRNDDLILTCREDGFFNIYDIKKINENFFNYNSSTLNITRQSNENILKNEMKENSIYKDLSNIDFTSKNLDNIIESPIYSSFESTGSENILRMENEIIKIIKKSINSSDTIYSLDKAGTMFIMICSIKGYNYRKKNDNTKYKNLNILKKLYEINLSQRLQHLLKGNELKCYDMKKLNNDREILNYGNIHSNNINTYYDIFLINTNLGLIKLILNRKNDFNIRMIHNNFEEKNLLTAFDISDNGLILAAFTDLTIKVLDLVDFNPIFEVNLALQNCDTLINKVFWATVICKNDKKQLIRKSLTANIFVITSKNEFIIYDLNQKNKIDIKKIKKKIELGAKKKLNRQNSKIDIS